MDARKPVVVMAGARGFLGQALVEELRDAYQVIGLSRRERAASGDMQWRACDLFSRAQAEQALRGADVAVYLVHSMLPSARLTQGAFEDLDLVCADNFARAARAAGVRHVVYVGGILPASRDVSRHLGSRHEVEQALGAYGTPVTSLRAGLIVGPGGSSTTMVVRLVKKLPALLCPAWTRMDTQPVALGDVVKLVRFCLDHPEQTAGQVFDVGGDERMTYKAMLRRTATIMGLRRVMVDVPVASPGLSARWVSAFTGAPMELVTPLIESLEHSMVAADRRLVDMAGLVPTPFDVCMRGAVEHELAREKDPVAFDKHGAANAGESTVRSVQRLPLPAGRRAAWVADEYARWLPSFFAPFFRVEADQRMTRFHLRGIRAPLLELERSDVSAEDRQVFWIRGGLLARPHPRGRLEFREVLGARAILAAIHDFRPRLPWFIYRHTQALVHVLVMHGFARHLAGVPARAAS